MNKTIAIIPARGGSKRLPNKNTMLLGGIPLLAHSILFAQKHSFIDEVFVTTNDEAIKEIAIQFEAKVIDRPENLSGDFEPTVSALKHVLENIEEVQNVVLLQPTNPLRPKNLLKETFDIFIKNNCDSLFTVTRNHQKFGKIIDNKFLPYNYETGQRSQDLEPLFFENGLIYITKSRLIFNDKIISENAFPFEVNHIFANVDIDTQQDFDYANYLLNNSNNEL
jgi:CMP-N-acetylneuraminic acid synthetase